MAGSTRQRGPGRELGHLSSRVAFKGGRKGLRLVIPPEMEFGELLAELRLKLDESGKFFHGARVLLDQGRRLLPDDFATLRTLLDEHGMELADQEDAPPAPAPDPELTMTVSESVRSGQCVKADGNLLVLGDVHAGAEVMAGRDVIIMGAAKGSITAGLISGHEAQVFAFVLHPTLLRLGDRVARSPGGDPFWRAEVARVRHGRIIVEPFTGWQREKSRRQRKR